MTGPGTNSYVVGAGRDLAVVDPGPAEPGHRAALRALAEERGARIRWILVTHTHPDHAPGAAALADDTGAEVIGFRPAEGFDPDTEVGDGWTLSADDFSLEAVHTPGHASDHLCWRHPQSGLLLTGDHVMHGSTVVIRPPDGDVAVYLASLAAVRRADPPRLAPGHGRIIDDPAPVLDALVAHRLGREARVAAALADAGRATVDDLLPRVYADVTEAQLPVARYSLWAHLRSLAGAGRAESEGAGDDEDQLAAPWRATGTTAP
jgi:glyoxylase-like metal-dependent hydrolase (beta-lactamase superfamily II)